MHLTSASGQDGEFKQYTPGTGTEFFLSKVFWDDLADVLRLVIVTRAALFEENYHVTDRLQSLSTWVRTLLEASATRPGWDTEARTSARFALADALQTLGEQGGQAEFFQEAVAAYRAVLEEWTRERVPLQWAAIQHDLGGALWRLGEREGGTARLKEAVEAYQAALKERTRERVPLDWAETQSNLGTALQALGERESGTARLEEATQAYRAALEEFTRERVPLQWALVQNNLGLALQDHW